DVLAEGIHVEGAPPGNVQVVLGVGGAIQGSATDERRQPQPNMTVALIPDLGLRGRPELYRSTSTDISGRFQFRGVAPGNYKVFAWEVIDKDVWQNPEYVRSIEDHGAFVEIREGSQSSVDVVAIP